MESKIWSMANHQDVNHWVVNSPRRWLFVIQQNGELTLSEQLENMKFIVSAPQLVSSLEKLVRHLETLPIMLPYAAYGNELQDAKDLLKKVKGAA